MGGGEPAQSSSTAASDAQSLTFTATGFGQQGTFNWQTGISGNTPQLWGNFVVDAANYFQNDKEWRVVLEWADDSTALTAQATRSARVGLYVPIKDNQFNPQSGTTRMNAAGFYRGGDTNAHRIMVAYQKYEGNIWDQDSNKSGFQLNNDQTKLEGNKGTVAFSRNLQASANGKDMSLVQGQTYNLGISWGVYQDRQSWWNYARADSSGNGNINSQKWTISPLKQVQGSGAYKIAASAAALALGAMTLY